MFKLQCFFQVMRIPRDRQWLLGASEKSCSAGSATFVPQANQAFTKICEIVKLHSNLRILTQLQLVGVGVGFVFPLEGRKEGRKEEEEEQAGAELCQAQSSFS